MGLKANVLISAGSNMGNRKENLQNALEALQEHGFELLHCSSVYETPPWGFESDFPFFNICFSGFTELSPTKLINLLIKVETNLGRVRHSMQQYASRTIDLDIILWNRLLIDSDLLKIPHPRAHQRRFVLQPAVEIEADWIHPVFNKTLKELLEECEDDAVIKKL